MRHRKSDTRLGRSSAHRRALLASLVSNLIDEKRIRTTLVKAKAAQRLADRMVTLARKGGLAARRMAVSELGRKRSVSRLFDEMLPQFEGRQGGYTRVVKLGQRRSDGAEMAVLEWVGVAPPEKKKRKKEAAADSKQV
jgi:large subunit ribosomal protein L17